MACTQRSTSLQTGKIPPRSLSSISSQKASSPARSIRRTGDIAPRSLSDSENTSWNFFESWWAFMSTRVDQIQVALGEHSVYVLTVLVLRASSRSVWESRPEVMYWLGSCHSLSHLFFSPCLSLALFTIFIPLVGLGFAPSFIALFLYSLLPIFRETRSLVWMGLIRVFWNQHEEWVSHRVRFSSPFNCRWRGR